MPGMTTVSDICTDFVSSRILSFSSVSEKIIARYALTLQCRIHSVSFEIELFKIVFEVKVIFYYLLELVKKMMQLFPF